MGNTPRGLGAQQLVNLWTRLTQRIISYDIGIEYRRLERPKLGIFDGLKISLDPAVDLEMQCFLLLHLFGHTVQWVAPSYRPGIVDASDLELEPYLDALEGYERDAARFGLQLLHEVGINELDGWFSDFAETDWKYVEAFYRTGVIPSWEACLTRAQRSVEPRTIPRLEPRLVDVRFAF